MNSTGPASTKTARYDVKSVTRTFKDYPGFTFERRTVGHAYARNGFADDKGRGTPEYMWIVYRNGRNAGSGTTLKWVKEIADIMIETGEFA